MVHHGGRWSGNNGLCRWRGTCRAACAAACQLLGAGVVIVGDLNKDRLQQARSFGCETVDVSLQTSLVDQIDQILGAPEIDCAVDCVGFEAHGHGAEAKKRPRPRS